MAYKGKKISVVIPSYNEEENISLACSLKFLKSRIRQIALTALIIISCLNFFFLRGVFQDINSYYSANDGGQGPGKAVDDYVGLVRIDID